MCVHVGVAVCLFLGGIYCSFIQLFLSDLQCVEIIRTIVTSEPTVLAEYLNTMEDILKPHHMIIMLPQLIRHLNMSVFYVSVMLLQGGKVLLHAEGPGC